MLKTFSAFRRLLLAPSFAAVTFEDRDFPTRPTEVTRRLEAIPQAVVCGFEWGIEVSRQWELERRLELVELHLRGFAYEGAAMALTVRDAMAGGRGHRARELLRGPGRPYLLLAYIGIGFAMARLPRVLWRNVLPDLTGVPYHPTMSWLAVDGYGFDRAYFETDRWVNQQRRPEPYPWQGRADYFLRAVDQGIGRSLWFIHGGLPLEVAAAVDRFPTGRRADLWSGVGLAAAFAGGCDAHGFTLLRRTAGRHLPDLAQGAVFAATGRTAAGHVPEHTELATGVLTGMTSTQAAELAGDLVVGGTEQEAEPDYEVWRHRIATRFAPELRVRS